MRAPGDLKFEEVPVPQIQDDEVLVKIMAVGVCGSDIPRMLTYGAHVSPIIPGHEFAGKIVKVGKGVQGWAEGDKVSAAPLIPCNECEWCQKGIYSLCEHYKYYGSRNDGAYAQYLGVKAENLLRLNADTPYAWGATIDPAANALHAYLCGEGTGEDTVCVYGLGAIGLFAIQYAKVLGCKTIIAVDVNDDKLAVARECGATDTVNSLKGDPVEAVLKITGGRGATLSMDMSGVPVAQHQAILSTGKMGRVVFLGISHKGLELSENYTYIYSSATSSPSAAAGIPSPSPSRLRVDGVRAADEREEIQPRPADLAPAGAEPAAGHLPPDRRPLHRLQQDHVLPQRHGGAEVSLRRQAARRLPPREGGAKRQRPARLSSQPGGPQDVDKVNRLAER